MLDARIVSSISIISSSREFCLNIRTYNISDKIRNRYIRGKSKGRDGVL